MLRLDIPFINEIHLIFDIDIGMKLVYFLAIFLLALSSSRKEKHGGGGGGYRPPYRPPHHPAPSPTSGLGVSNIFKVLLLAYLASLAVGLHLLNTSVNITSLMGRDLDLSAFHQDEQEQEVILTRLNLDD